MNIAKNPDWERFRAHGIASLGYAGFADWLEFAAHRMRTEPQRMSNMQPDHCCPHGVFCPHHDEPQEANR